ncbi:MAG: hypothetical protein ACRCWG_05860 [Sarcina sp.]
MKILKRLRWGLLGLAILWILNSNSLNTNALVLLFIVNIMTVIIAMDDKANKKVNEKVEK